MPTHSSNCYVMLCYVMLRLIIESKVIEKQVCMDDKYGNEEEK